MGRTDVASRTVAAPPERVFAALVDADARAAWLPPRGMTGRFTWFDPRPGGGYRMVLTYLDDSVGGKTQANQDVTDVVFVVVDPPRRIVEEARFVSEDLRLAGTMTIEWAVTATADGARVTVTASDVPEGVDDEDHRAALASTLANLAAHLDR